MVGVERKRACGSVGACEKGRVEMRVVRQAAGVRSSWRMRIEDSMAGVGWWLMLGFRLKCGRVQMGSLVDAENDGQGSKLGLSVFGWCLTCAEVSQCSSICKLYVAGGCCGLHTTFKMGEHFKKVFFKHEGMSPEEKALKWV